MSNYASRSIVDTSAGHSSQIMADTERGVLPSGYEIAQSMDWDCEIDPFYECHNILLGTEKQPSHMLIHPDGEAGVVTITGKRKRDGGAVTITGKRKKRDSNWTKDETSNLITLKKEIADNGSQTCKGRSGWDAIAKKMATSRTSDQCRRRWETLIKSYQKIKTYCGNKTVISELTQAERAELKLATTISEDWWYDVIGKIITSGKLDDASVLDVIDDLLPPNLPLGTPPIQILAESFEQGESSRREAAASGSSPVKRDFNSAETSDHPMWSPGLNQPTRESYPEQKAILGFDSMSHTLKCTLLNLILAWPTINFNGEMEAVCRWLAIIQDRQPTDTRSFVLELRERDLLTFWKNEKVIWLKLGHLQVYSEFAKQAVRTHCYRVGVNNMLAFESMSPRTQTRVLTLLNCLQLERVDLGNFPMLRSLVIKNCPLLESVCGWETLPELRWLEIDECRSYRTYPEVHCLPSLREARFDRRFSSKPPIVLFEPRFSQCVRLSRLELSGDGYLKESGDLSTLKCLKLLSFTGCEALCTITGLSGLHSLVKLNVQDCKSLTTLPGLAHLKSLEELNISGSGLQDITDVEELYCVTHLDLGFCKALHTLPHLAHLRELEHLNVSGSGVQEISVVTELQSLRKLDLSGCEALKTLPHLGHLKALAELNVDFTGLEEIPGVDMLESLEAMDCYRSQLKWLPPLHHLPLLQWVDLRGTPVTVIDPSSIYYEKGIVTFNREVGGQDRSVTNLVAVNSLTLMKNCMISMGSFILQNVIL